MFFKKKKEKKKSHFLPDFPPYLIRVKDLEQPQYRNKYFLISLYHIYKNDDRSLIAYNNAICDKAGSRSLDYNVLIWTEDNNSGGISYVVDVSRLKYDRSIRSTSVPWCDYNEHPENYVEIDWIYYD